MCIFNAPFIYGACNKIKTVLFLISIVHRPCHHVRCCMMACPKTHFRCNDYLMLHVCYRLINMCSYSTKIIYYLKLKITFPFFIPILFFYCLRMEKNSFNALMLYSHYGYENSLRQNKQVVRFCFLKACRL